MICFILSSSETKDLQNLSSKVRSNTSSYHDNEGEFGHELDKVEITKLNGYQQFKDNIIPQNNNSLLVNDVSALRHQTQVIDDDFVELKKFKSPNGTNGCKSSMKNVRSLPLITDILKQQDDQRINFNAAQIVQ